MNSFESNSQTDNSVTVGMHEWWVSTPDSAVLETKGLGPCIGIAAYNRDTKTGYMAHIAVPMFESESLDQLFALIASDNPDRQALQVWIRGGQKSSAMTSTFDMPQMGRDDILNRVAELGLSEDNIDISWDESEMGSQGTRMLLDTVTGTFESEALLSKRAVMTLGDMALEN